MEKKVSRYLKLGVKIALTLSALFFVFKKVPFQKVVEIIREADFYLLGVAFLFFVLSKLISSFRLNLFFKKIGVRISEKQNLCLYWLGMFYNMFLPGGIGGDGYKIVLLKDKCEAGKKSLLAAILMDRLSGLLALCVLVAFLYGLVPEVFSIPHWLGLIWGVISVFLFFVIGPKIFTNLRSIFIRVFSLSLGVQSLQLICAAFILMSLDLNESSQAGYLFLFLISSVVSVIPFTVGGIGARELAFTYGSPFLGLNMELALGLSLLFYCITALTSFFGVYFSLRKINLN